MKIKRFNEDLSMFDKDIRKLIIKILDVCRIDVDNVDDESLEWMDEIIMDYIFTLTPEKIEQIKIEQESRKFGL